MSKKTLFLILIGLLLVTAPMSGNAPDRKRTVAYEELPVEAQDFVRQYFPGLSCSSILVEDREYTVTFKEGLSIEFDRKGQWEEVVSIDPIVNMDYIPEKIAVYLNSHHPDQQIMKISYHPGDFETYEVKMKNRLELKFSMEGNFLYSEVD